ncbi:MAG: peptide deformylase [Alphaproteobacteria bacterium]|nr:peptide deformylase [Alphaproteobacteria bacterium]
MAIIPEVTVDGPNSNILTTRAAKVKEEEFNTEELKKLVSDITETKDFHECVGMSGPNLGIDKRIIIIGTDPEANKKQAGHHKVETKVVINPVLTPLGNKKIWGIEACLSVPGVHSLVPRHKTVQCSGQSVEGDPVEFVVSGYPSRIMQHENDHLNGILFPSRAEENKALWAKALFPCIMFYDLKALNKASEQKKDPVFIGPGMIFENQPAIRKNIKFQMLSGAFIGNAMNMGRYDQWPLYTWDLGGVSKELLAIGAGAVIFPILMINAIGLVEGTYYKYDLKNRYQKASAQIASTGLYKKAHRVYKSFTLAHPSLSLKKH